MITPEQVQNLVIALKSHTQSSIMENQFGTTPYSYKAVKTTRYPTGHNISDGFFATMPDDQVLPSSIHQILEHKTMDEVEADGNTIVDSMDIYEGDDYIFTSSDLDEIVKKGRVYFWQMNCLVDIKEYHYDDKWYSAVDSVDYPYKSFGIIRVDHMAYLSFEPLMNKKSFIMRADAMMYAGLCEPFMLFIDRKFVNLYDIDVVYDCGTTYFLLHGKQYTYFNLQSAEIHMAVLPYNLDYIGYESDEMWSLYYDMLVEYLQSTLTLNSANKICINVPDIDTVYDNGVAVYGVGAWMYTQVRLDYLGLLSEEHVSELKKIYLTYREYDQSGNVINTVTTRFNALDKDSYDKDVYHRICHMDYDMYIQDAVFRFDSSTGLLDMENGDNIIAFLDEDFYRDYAKFTDSEIYYDQSGVNQRLYRKNYLTFKDGMFWPEMTYDTEILNNIHISNPDKNTIEFFTFLNPTTEFPMSLYKDFSKDYLNLLVKDYIGTDKEDDYATFLKILDKYLEYKFTDENMYMENQLNGFDTIMKYDPRLFNSLYGRNVYTRTFTGAEANENLISTICGEERTGLKIPRAGYKGHETYVMVFQNGELLDTYYRTIAFANYFFIPMEEDSFVDSDTIEIVYIPDINNNEIHFSVTDSMLGKNFIEVEDNEEFLKVDMFPEFIKPEEMKIFCDYPGGILEYFDLIDRTDDIAFNISTRIDGDLYVFADLFVRSLLLAILPNSGVIPDRDELDKKVESRAKVAEYNTIWELEDYLVELLSTGNYLEDTAIFTAASERKFIYQRLYVDKMSYRIKLSGRFRYCDNQKQYMLFINGRRISTEGYLITIPKHTRPFWGMYLYTAKFVGPDDRIELFYVPYEANNINMNDEVISFNSDGYIETEMNNLEVPLDTDLYEYYVNGKRIPSNWLTNVDTHTMRLSEDTKSLQHFIVDRLYRDTFDPVVEYLKGEDYSIYDGMIDLVKTSSLGYDTLDDLFNIHIKITDVEDDMIAWNTGPIAIINEIIRDFWVTSGYQYNDVVKFLYDYVLDEYLVWDEDKQIRVLPSMDATQYINIQKNYIHLLYFLYDPEDNMREIGSYLELVTLTWEYSDPLYGDQSECVLSQSINGEDIGTEARKYMDDTGYTTGPVEYVLRANTTSGTVSASVTYYFYNGIYYGNIDEDSLQWYRMSDTYLLENMYAVRPDDQIIPSSTEQEEENKTVAQVEEKNSIIYDIGLSDDTVVEPDPNEGIDPNDDDDGPAYGYNSAGVIEYYKASALHMMMPDLNKVIQDTVKLDLVDYVIGPNKYFVYAAPSRLCYDGADLVIRFVCPDITDLEMREANIDEHTDPLFTNGWWDSKGQLIRLDKFEMQYMGSFSYTNPSGYTEMYSMWKSNGFFTRSYDTYGFKISVYSSKENDTGVQTVF